MKTTDLEQQRLRVIDESGWSGRVSLFQPRNAMFWVYWALVLSGGWTLVSYIRVNSGVVGGAITFGAFWLILYGALFWWVTRTMDRYSRLPISLLVLAVLWGGAAATVFMASFANTAILDLYAKTFGQAWAADWGAGLTAPFIEEPAKAIGLVVLMVLAPRIVRTAYDGFIIGAFLGLGFLVVEDITYVISAAGSLFGAHPVQASLLTLGVRILTGVAGHVAFTAIFGAGLIYLIGTPAQRRRIGLGVLLIATAIALHGFWDNSAAIARPVPFLPILLPLALMAATLLITIRVFSFTVRRERADMTAILAPEVRDGIVPADLASAVAGDRHDRRAYITGTSHHSGKRRARHVLDAARDYANALGRGNAQEDELVAHTRAEVQRLTTS